MVEEEAVSLIRLHSIEGFGNSGILAAFKKTQNPKEILARIDEFSYKPIKNSLSVHDAKKQLDYINQNNISIIPIYSPQYPPQLRTIEKPPAILYSLGNEKLLLNQSSLAVVGTRKYSPYGKEVCSLLLPEIAKHSIPIVSGMAIGIDSFAHEQALNNNGPTIAVLGSGVNIISPMQNTHLYHRIVESGCIISEFPIDFQAQRYTFTQRNRIVSGLAKALLVIEAGEKSGTMITTNHALEQGREVCVVPGPITSFSSQGTNKLLQLGATPITNPQDLLDIFLLKTAPFKKPILSDPTHQLIVNALYDGSRTIEDLSIKTGLLPTELMLATSELELDGTITGEGDYSFTLRY